MNFQSLSTKQKLSLFILFVLLIILPLALFLTGQIQELRKRAEGTKEVDLQFEPSLGIKSRGEVFKVEIKLYKTAQREIKVSGAQAVILTSDKLAINSAECVAPFNALSVARIDGQTITFMCSIAVGTDPPTLSTLGQNFASFEVKVKDDAAFGEALLSFSSTRVTEANVPGQAPDVSTSGQPASYTISEQVSPTPSMTVTPTPITTPIPSPTQTIPTSPSPPPIHPCPEKAKRGDYDCNERVEETDFTQWLKDFLQGQTSLSFFEYWRRAFYGGSGTLSPTPTPRLNQFLTKNGELWWLVDKSGNKFFSLGVSGPKYPSKTQSPELFEYLKAHGIDEEQYLSDMFGNLKKWNFNSLAGWAPHEFNLALWQKGGEPLYSFITIHTISSDWDGDIDLTLKDVNNNPYPSKHTFPDPFNPQWKQKAEERIQEMIVKFRDTPFLIGYFIDNELGFSEFNRFIWSSYSLPEFIKFLREKYNNDIKQLNQRWSVNYVSFEDIVSEKYNLDKSTNQIIRQDIEDFTFKIVEAYIDTTISLVRKYDDKHLIMSNRFMRWKFEDAKKYLPLFSKYDVIALNRYPRGEKFSEEDLEVMTEVYEITGRPILISEWSIGAKEGFSIGDVSNQEEREKAYKTCLKQLLELPFVIGAHWFRMTDQKVIEDGQEVSRNLGLIDSEYKPYPLTFSFADFHSQINELRGAK